MSESYEKHMLYQIGNGEPEDTLPDESVPYSPISEKERREVEDQSGRKLTDQEVYEYLRRRLFRDMVADMLGQKRES